MRVTVPDSIIDLVEPHVTASRTVDDLVTHAVARIGHIAPQHRCIVLDEAALNALEMRLGAPILATVEDLHRAVDKHAGLSLGKISFDFTPEQFIELKDRAGREGVTVQDYARRVIQAMIPQFFLTAPAQTAPSLTGPRK